MANNWSGGRRYLFNYPKYEARCILTTGIWSRNCRDLFSYLKYEVRHIPETWPVVGGGFPTQNMKPVIYLKPDQLQVTIFLPKIWSPSCTLDLTGCRYLFFSQNIKPDIYLQPIPVPIVIGTWFHIFDSKNRNVGAYLQIFCCRYLIVDTCFRFSICKNHYAGAVAADMPAGGIFI